MNKDGKRFALVELSYQDGKQVGFKLTHNNAKGECDPKNVFISLKKNGNKKSDGPHQSFKEVISSDEMKLVEDKSSLTSLAKRFLNHLQLAFEEAKRLTQNRNRVTVSGFVSYLNHKNNASSICFKKFSDDFKNEFGFSDFSLSDHQDQHINNKIVCGNFAKKSYLLFSDKEGLLKAVAFIAQSILDSIISNPETFSSYYQKGDNITHLTEGSEISYVFDLGFPVGFDTSSKISKVNQLNSISHSRPSFMFFR